MGPKRNQTQNQSKKKAKEENVLPTPKTNQAQVNDFTVLPAPEVAYDRGTNPDNPSSDVTRIETPENPTVSSTTNVQHEGNTKPSTQNENNASSSLEPNTTSELRGAPLTPPPDGRSDRSRGSNVPPRFNTKDLAALDEFLETMKRTFNTMGTTFDMLGQQTIKVAELGPTVDARYQISAAEKHAKEHYERQETRMNEFKEDLRKRISAESVKVRIQEAVSAIVKDIIRREIAQRVQRELQMQIGQDLRDQVSTYKRKIIEVQTSLHNSEARRHNALMRSNSLNEPLKPLLRPFSPESSSPTGPRTACGPLSSEAIAGWTPVGGKDGKDQRANITLDKTKSAGASANLTKTQTQNVKTGAHIDSASGRRDSTSTDSGKPILPTIITDFADPTPSPLFPKDLTSLMRLSPHETRTLMEDYGLVPVRRTGTPMVREGGKNVAPPQAEAEFSKEDHINRFLNHIGVGIQVIASPNGKTPTTPFVTMMQH